MKRKKKQAAAEEPTAAQKRLAESLIAEARRYTATEFGHSRWAAFHECETKHHLLFHQHVRPKKRPLAPDIGTLVHIALAAQELAAKNNLQLQLWQEAIRTSHRPPEVTLEATRLVAGYFLFWGVDNGGWGEGTKLIGIEEYLSAAEANSASGKSYKVGRPIGFPHSYSTRYDQIVETWLRSDDGELLKNIAYPVRSKALVDHKTRGTRIKDVRKFVRLAHADTQFLGHAYLWRERTGEHLPVIYNAIVKTKVPEYMRIVIHYKDEELDRWAANQAKIELRRLPLMQDPEHDTLMNYEACVPPIGSPCDFFDWCHGDEQSRLDNYYMAEAGERYGEAGNGNRKEEDQEAHGNERKQVQVPDPDVHRKGRRKRRVLEAPADERPQSGEKQLCGDDGAKAAVHRKRRRP